MNIKKGDTFYAIVKKGPHSKTLGGEEKAGRKVGPFVADAVHKYGSVDADIYRFSPTDWFFVKVTENNIGKKS